MKPKSLSATSVHVFESCPARAGAESFNRTPTTNNSAADLGTAIHGALQRFHEVGMLTDPDGKNEVLVRFFDEEYDLLFGSDGSRKEEGRELCQEWFARNHPILSEVLSVEVKDSFPLTVTWRGQKVTVPFNYIWDRCDRLSNGDVEVVDYKSIAIPLTPEEMKQRIQVRAYALAAKIKYPEAKRIWVSYDMLRHGVPVGVSFTEDELKDTYRYLQAVLRRVLDADANNLEEKINPECRWCVRKHACATLKKHAAVQGVHAATPDQAAERKLELESVVSAMHAMINELDDYLMRQLEHDDVLEAKYGGYTVRAGGQTRREVDADRVKDIVPSDVWERYGSAGMSLKAFDQMLKDPKVTPEMKVALKDLVTKKVTKLKAKVSKSESEE